MYNIGMKIDSSVDYSPVLIYFSPDCSWRIPTVQIDHYFNLLAENCLFDVSYKECVVNSVKFSCAPVSFPTMLRKYDHQIIISDYQRERYSHLLFMHRDYVIDIYLVKFVDGRVQNTVVRGADSIVGLDQLLFGVRGSVNND